MWVLTRNSEQVLSKLTILRLSRGGGEAEQAVGLGVCLEGSWCKWRPCVSQWVCVGVSMAVLQYYSSQISSVLYQFIHTQYYATHYGCSQIIMAAHSSSWLLTVHHACSQFIMAAHSSSWLLTVHHGCSQLLRAASVFSRHQMCKVGCGIDAVSKCHSS